MAKHYGIKCDRCKADIHYPSQHYKLVLKCQLNNLDREDFDLCSGCYEIVRKLVIIPISVE